VIPVPSQYITEDGLSTPYTNGSWLLQRVSLEKSQVNFLLGTLSFVSEGTFAIPNIYSSDSRKDAPVSITADTESPQGWGMGITYEIDEIENRDWEWKMVALKVSLHSYNTISIPIYNYDEGSTETIEVSYCSPTILAAIRARIGCEYDYMFFPSLTDYDFVMGVGLQSVNISENYNDVSATLTFSGIPEMISALYEKLYSMARPIKIYVRIYGYDDEGTASLIGEYLRFVGYTWNASISLTETGATLTIQCVSIKKKLEDEVITGIPILDGMEEEEALQTILDNAGLGDILYYDTYSSNRALPVSLTPSYNIEAGTSIWEALTEIAQYFNVWMWVNRYGYLHYKERENITPEYTLTIGASSSDISTYITSTQIYAIGINANVNLDTVRNSVAVVGIIETKDEAWLPFTHRIEPYWRAEEGAIPWCKWYYEGNTKLRNPYMVITKAEAIYNRTRYPQYTASFEIIPNMKIELLSGIRLGGNAAQYGLIDRIYVVEQITENYDVTQGSATMTIETIAIPDNYQFTILF